MNEIKVFRDPLYGYIKVYDPIIWKLIQTKEFQRLRRIHQLGGTSMVFHTAEHSRFSHSLGVYEIARRIVYEVDELRQRLTKEERLITLCAALLHDLGHGPYSHAFEAIFQTSHEDYTLGIILGNTEVNQILEMESTGLAQKVANIIAKTCHDGNCKSGKCNHAIMISLISSQLDADRIDYLKRDAYNTGATYGEIDQDRIIRSILVVNDQIAFKYTSLHAIENYLVSRYHMYWQVYYHPVCISYEVILIKIFQRAKALLDKETDINISPVIKNLLNESLSLDDHFNLDEVLINYQIKRWMNESNDSILKDLCERFINRKLFKYITCDNQDELDKLYYAFKEAFTHYGINIDYYLHKDTIVKEAYQYYTEEAKHHSPILLYHRNQLIEIAEVSHIVKGIKDVGAKKDFKLYFSIDVLKLIKKTDQQAIKAYFKD